MHTVSVNRMMRYGAAVTEHGCPQWLRGPGDTRYVESIASQVLQVGGVRVCCFIGTTFAAVPDLIRMFRQRSSKGVNPTMAGIIGAFQILWIYYGLLIVSRPVAIPWNLVGVMINSLTVWAYLRFARIDADRAGR